jgi:signal peptidase I
MEPTLHCAQPQAGCLAHIADAVVVKALTSLGDLRRGDIVAFRTPAAAVQSCGAGGVFLKRLIGLPGETVREDAHGFITINGKKLSETYVSPASRADDSLDYNKTWRVPSGMYFMLGDNRGASCDSRRWGAVPGSNIIGVVAKIIRTR